MFRQPQRIRIDEIGRMVWVDPAIDALPLLRSIDPRFRIQSSQLQGFKKPRIHAVIRTSTILRRAELPSIREGYLWQAHDRAMTRLRLIDTAGSVDNGVASLLDVKRELGRRLLRSCVLCAHRCGVNREAGQKGRCGLGVDAVAAEAFVHIAEEAPINPSLVINVAGCGLRCRFCQQSNLLKPAQIQGAALDVALWRRLEFTGARSLSFVGGNPDESLPRVLDFLSGTPAEFALPIVWNAHGYQTSEAMRLLDGLIDAYVPDFKFGNDRCATVIANAPGYVEAARATIRLMLRQRVPVIVRILVLPGHHECCHVPALDALQNLNGSGLRVSVRGQYCPDWRIAEEDGDLARRASASEIAHVRRDANERGLMLIDECESGGTGQ